ncbi:MAG: cytochrome c [Pseudolabrys sp.]|nr:cytochrome c [Pseudolabrys sp.]MDP2294860.1 cytochrome c [Pseudolabrys sp.]
MTRQRRLHINAALALLASFVLPDLAQAQDPSDIGRALLRENCASCHAIGKTGDSPRAGAPPFRGLSRSYDLDAFPRQLQRGVVSGHPDMPEFRFNEADARAAGVYLRSIQE